MDCYDGPAAEISLGAYIFYRLKSLGIHHVFGCPGDFNLNFLDHLSTVPSMKWVGTCNELNAAYAADGYSRTRGLPGALVTTYGVGELSAINGISGAYSEHVPIIHMVGTTSRLAMKDRIMIHHTLDEDWDHTTFQSMSAPVRASSAFLVEDESFTRDVDRVIEDAFKKRRPVYLFIPMDCPDILVDPSPLFKPLNVEIKNPSAEVEEEIVEMVLSRLEKARKPIILVDVLVHRYGVAKAAQKFIKMAKIPAFVTPLAKSIVDETSDEFRGLYNGQLTPDPTVKQDVESADLIIHLGPLPSDSNTGGWSQNLPEAALITFHHSFISCGRDRWNEVHFAPVLNRLANHTRTAALVNDKLTPRHTQDSNGVNCPSGPLEQHHFWKEWSRFLRRGDLVIAEVGSAQYGTLEINLPAEAEFYTQLYYSCIGFSVGALLGSLVARRELGKKGRVILFVGDGSLHMTVQEISTIIRQGFNPIIVVINNLGYTIERIIHGPTQAYNDISETWDYQGMLKFFGGNKTKSYSASTYEELSRVLDNQEFANSSQARLLEVILDKFDAPWMLTEQINIVQAKTIARLKAWDEQYGRRRRVLETNLYTSSCALEDSPSNIYLKLRRDGEIDIDPNRIILAGVSAGGGLAAGTALLARDCNGSRIMAQLLSCPMLDDRNVTKSSLQYTDEGLWTRDANLAGWRALLGDRVGGSEVSIYAAPGRAEDLSGLPPAFIDAGSAEVFRDEAVDYASRLCAAGVQAELHVWPGGWHGFEGIVPTAALSQHSLGVKSVWMRHTLAGYEPFSAAVDLPALSNFHKLI